MPISTTKGATNSKNTQGTCQVQRHDPHKTRAVMQPRTQLMSTKANTNAEFISLLQYTQVNNLTIFRFVQNNISVEAKKLFISYSKYIRSIIKLELDIEFLTKCINFDILPSHIINSTKAIAHLTIDNPKIRHKVNQMGFSITSQMLELEISDYHLKKKRISKEKYDLFVEIRKICSKRIVKLFRKYYSQSIDYLITEWKNTHNKKFDF